ncbi:unnamed protein product [Linum tenue]|uniref:Uncharacterized protein n=1 Tax=Linum tenue TaxID=586396 RepID=A0AAV0N977_9ROSI|nr:unnamed protein product [Linum tenue]
MQLESSDHSYTLIYHTTAFWALSHQSSQV